MSRRAFLLLALVTTGRAAQSNHLIVVINSPSHSKYFVQRTLKDSAGADRLPGGESSRHGGRDTVRTVFGNAQTLWIGSMEDSAACTRRSV